MDLGAATHPGYVRTDNEDGFFVSREEAVFAVADGMGGHEHGEVASRLALEAIAKHAVNLSQAPPSELANDLYDVVQAANALILQQAEEQDARNRMGTTLVLATICGDRLYFAHIGDSRLYLLRGEIFTQLTRDHSLVQTMVDSGEISAEEAAIHPLRHQITRVVGGDNRVSPEIASQALEPGDMVLLCSDGLSGAVDPDMIKSILRTRQSAQERADALVQAALSVGGPDNITAVVISYQSPRPLPLVPSTVATTRHSHKAAWLSVLFTLLAVLLLATAGGIWQYTHPTYLVAVDVNGALGLYKSWPLLPMLTRQQVPTPDVPALTLTEARPYLTQPRFQPKSGDMAAGIKAPGKDAGTALLTDIVSMTAAGLLDKAQTALSLHDLVSAQDALSRAKALQADPLMVRQLSLQLKIQQSRRWHEIVPRQAHAGHLH